MRPSMRPSPLSNTAATEARPAERMPSMSLCYSPARAVLSALLWLAAAPFVWTLGWMGSVLLGAWSLGLGAVAALGCGLGVWQALRRLRDREPVLLLDAQGLHDRRVGPQPIPWRAMRGLSLGVYRGSTSLLIGFHSLATLSRVLQRPVGLNDRLFALERWPVSNEQWGVQLGPLACQPREVLALARRLHAQALRQRPGSGDEPAPASPVAGEPGP